MDGQSPIPQNQDAQIPIEKRKSKLTRLNLILAAISYSLSLFLIIFLLVFSSQGSFAQVITSSISLVGAVFLILAIAASFIDYFMSKKQGKLIAVNRLTLMQILLIWSPVLLSSVAYGLHLQHYGNSNNPNQARAITLILDCKVSYIQQSTGGLISLEVTDSDPTQGGIYTRANWGTLVNAVNTANRKCPNKTIYYGSESLSWLTLAESKTMIMQCKLDLVKSDNVLSHPSTHWDYFKARELDSERPTGTETGYLLTKSGNYSVLTADYTLESQITPIVNQYKNTCKKFDNLLSS